MPESELLAGTLPSLEAALPGQCAAPRLLLTIVFHPQVERIGESALLADGHHLLGRDRLDFARNDETAQPLQDPHVSRRTLALDFDNGAVRLTRLPSACRCRLDGRDLLAPLSLSGAELARGAALLISHTVLLWVRTVGAAPPGPAADFGLTGDSHYMQDLRRQIDAASRSDLDVLLLGPTGTGKDCVARAIHANSRRRDRQMLAINLAAVPAALAPAVLFGAARGAFTGADRARQGYFQQAAGGTLFLDEIGDAPEEVQPLLLRALEQREVQVVGGATETVDVRVIAATDAPVDDARGGFKAALRHRLGALEIHLRALRDHPEDIGPLLWQFLADAFAREGRSQLLPGPHSSASELSAWAGLFHACLRYPWPGNVRELKNLCNQVALASTMGLVVPAALQQRLADADPGVAEHQAGAAIAPAPLVPGRKLADVPGPEFEQAWHAYGREVRAVARELGVSRQSVYRKVAASDRYRLAADVPEAELQQALREAGGDPAAAAHLLQVSTSGLRARLRQGQRQAGG